MPEIVTSPILLILVGVMGYLLGSVPFGIVITRALGLGDLRSIGSGNIGATNVLRTGHKGAALATLLLDAGKGAIAVLIARLAVGEDAAQLAGGMAFLGCWPWRLSRSSLPGLAGVQGRQGRCDLPWHADCAGLARRPRGLRHMGGDRGHHPHLFGLGPRGGGLFRVLVSCLSAR